MIDLVKDLQLYQWKVIWNLEVISNDPLFIGSLYPSKYHSNTLQIPFKVLFKYPSNTLQSNLQIPYKYPSKYP